MSILLLIVLLPVLGFLMNGLFGKFLPKSIVATIACALPMVSFVLAASCFLKQVPINDKIFTWAMMDGASFDFSLCFDKLSGAMTLIITGVGSLIHIYSVGYMSHDEGFKRYFSYLNLFLFFMLLLVLGNNLLVLFVGWEGVGLCSYLLIGFWFKEIKNAIAGKKAFITNRIGDAGLLIGMFLIYCVAHTLDMQSINAFSQTFADTRILNMIGIFLFIGAIGKSAQIPLYVWLPDAMAGPTPVSALIHAATMVTAGVYMIVRLHVLYLHADVAMSLIAVIGTLTAFFAATIAITQRDIKKILAYSTISQLGFMFAALGAGAFAAGFFHVYTHAFFKALLFLGAGSVIHALDGEQDIFKMGGLRKKLPITFLTFLIGTLCIAGIPPFSGFFSKDEILLALFNYNKFLYGLCSLTAMITAFYMSRLFILVFTGKPKEGQHAHESPFLMTSVLSLLALLSIASGFIYPELEEVKTPANHMVLVISVILALLGIGLAILVYGKKREFLKMPALHKILSNKYYIDEFYDSVIVTPLRKISEKLLFNVFDRKVFDGFLNGAASLVRQLAGRLSAIQAGSLQAYVFYIFVSLLIIISWGLYHV